MINIFRCNVHHQQGIWCFKVHPNSVSSDQCWRWPLRPKWKFIGLHKTADHALAIQPDLIYRSPSAAILARKAKASVAVSDEGSWLCKTLSWRKCLGVQGAGTWRKLLGSRKDKKTWKKFKAFSIKHHAPPPLGCCNGPFFFFFHFSTWKIY